MTQSNNEQEIKSFFPVYSKGYLNYARMGRLQLTDLTKKSRVSSAMMKYSKDDVIKFLDSPERYEKQLRDISRRLYQISPQYKRAINHFSKMPRMDYIIEPYGINAKKAKPETIESQYFKVCEFVEMMNIKHEFLKILNIAFREDVFYGYEHMTEGSYFIQKLNPDYCRISSFEDGVYNFAFDFSFFDKFPEQLEMYSSEFVSKYKKFKKDKDLKFQELDSKRTICIKVNEDIETIIPPLAGVFESIYDLADYKKLKKATKQIGAYKLLAMKVPMKDGKEAEVNSFLVDYDTMMEFHNRSADSVPEEIGVITVPFDVEAIDFSKGINEDDYVGTAETWFWNGVGVSQLIFNTDKSSSIGLDKSIKSDEQIVFAVLRQIERWINRRLKFEFKSIKFKINILNTTIYNWEDILEKAIDSATYGLPTISIAIATLGFSPSSVVNMAFLENDVLGLKEKLIPLSSSHTESKNGKDGAPEKKSVSEEGLRTRDGEKNKMR